MIDTIEPKEYERSSETSYDLYIFNNDRHTVPKTFTPLHYTSLCFIILVDTSLLPI